jgi:hypothetical protein
MNVDEQDSLLMAIAKARAWIEDLGRMPTLSGPLATIADETSLRLHGHRLNA